MKGRIRKKQIQANRENEKLVSRNKKLVDC